MRLHNYSNVHAYARKFSIPGRSTNEERQSLINNQQDYVDDFRDDDDDASLDHRFGDHMQGSTTDDDIDPAGCPSIVSSVRSLVQSDDDDVRLVDRQHTPIQPVYSNVVSIDDEVMATQVGFAPERGRHVASSGQQRHKKQSPQRRHKRADKPASKRHTDKNNIKVQYSPKPTSVHVVGNKLINQLAVPRQDALQNGKSQCRVS